MPGLDQKELFIPNPEIIVVFISVKKSKQKL
jgi:hypothetical protein